MPPTGGAAVRLAPENGNAAPTANRDGADHRKENSKLGASTSNRYEPRPASSTGQKPGPRKKQPKQSADVRFAGETPKQIVLHREIARRYSWDDRDKPDRRRPNAKLNTRMRELERLFDDRWGPTLPDDDSGRDDLFIAAHHLAQFGDPHQHIPAWARDRAPWASDAESTALIDRVIRKPRKWGAQRLGDVMRLTSEERERLEITTFRAFGFSDADMEAKRDASEAGRQRARRRAAGAVDRSEYEAASAARNRPWEAFGIGRATYYRRLKAGTLETGDLPSCETETGPYAAEYRLLLRTHLSHGCVPGVEGAGLVSGSQTVLDGREALSAPPAATKTVIDRPTSTKTVLNNKKEDCLCFYREAGTDFLSQPCPCHDASEGQL
jgi:hypothetical protein